MNRNRKEGFKLVLILVGILLFMAVFWAVLSRFEKRVPVAAEDDFLTDDIEDKEDKAEALGSIKLNGTKYEYFHEIETYLFMGTDASGNESGEGDEYQGSMADFLLLMVLDKTEGTYQFLQLNRDIMTEVTLLQNDGTGMATADIQLCTAHWYGGTREQGCENTVRSVSKLLGGITIDGYYSLNMENIPDLNQAVGGVELTLEEDFTHVDSKMKKGAVITLSDQQAFYYLHDRYGVGDETNTSRMKRQKQYMKAFMKKAKERLKEDASFVNVLYQKLQTNAVTDISGGQLSRVTQALSESENKGILELKGRSKLGKALGDGLEHVEFYPDKESIVDVMTDLYGLEEKK